MFNLFKKNEFEILSQKIKNKNHNIIETLNKNEFKKFFKLNEKEQKEKLRKIIEELSGLDFSLVFAYSFHFEDLPMFTYNLHIKENDYLLVVYGRNDFFGFQCDYFLSENVFKLNLVSNEEIQENEDVFKNLIGKETFDVVNKITKTSFEVTKKAKKLHNEMIGTMYLNEFSYNERMKNPIKVK
jgi:alanine-alpha-ketoisovalerate/valine-pyruvate aminotransferase